MNNQTQSLPIPDFSPALKMYMDSMESWKENYEKLLQTSNASSSVQRQDLVVPDHKQAMSAWQKGGEELFKRFVEEQIEICRFYAKRWENYLRLPEQLERSRTPAETAQLQFDFFTRMAAEYAQENAKLMQPMNEFMARWMSGQHMI
jgi:hypothetical protein